MDVLSCRRSRQINDGRKKSAGKPAPDLAAIERVVIGRINFLVVAVGREAAARRENVCKRAGADFDFQNAAIVRVGFNCGIALRIVEVFENEFGGGCGDWNDR